MLIVCNRAEEETSIPLRLLSIETGEVLRELRQPIRAGKKLDIIEQFNERLMLKQEGSDLLIVDLLKNTVVKVAAPPHSASTLHLHTPPPPTRPLFFFHATLSPLLTLSSSRPLTQVKDSFFRTPSAFIFLYENQTFLAFKDNKITVWNFRGELINEFEDHNLCFPIPDIDHTSVIYITQAQDIIISLCEDADGGGGGSGGGGDAAGGGGGGGGDSDGSGGDGGNAVAAFAELTGGSANASSRVSIHVSNIHTGKLLAQLDRRHIDAHNNITALCYVEETGDIITGSEHGKVQVWSASGQSGPH